MESANYKQVLGSDVPNDGMYVELQNELGQILVCVFRSDVTGEFEVSFGVASAPQPIIDEFVVRAKEMLTARARS